MAALEPWKYQLEAVEHFIDPKAGNMRLVIADEMGLGKTGEALLAWLKVGLPGPCILLGRVNALAAFKRQCSMWGVPEPIVVRGKSPYRHAIWNQLRAALGARKRNEGWDNFRGLFYCTTREAARRDVKAGVLNPAWCRFLIIDEAHRDANRKTANYRLARQFAGHNSSRGCILLTGTPKGYSHTWGLLNIARPWQFPSYWGFLEQHYIVDKQGPFGWEVLCLKSEKAFKEYLASTGAWLRRMKADVKKDMPPLIRDITSNVLEMSDVQKYMYNTILDEGLLELSRMTDLQTGRGSERSVLAIPSVMTKITRMRQVLVCPKIIDPQCGDYGTAIERLVEMLDEADNKHMVIFTPFTAAIPFIMERLLNGPEFDSQSNKLPPIFEFRGQAFKNADELLAQVAAFQKHRGIAICSISFAESFDLTPATWDYFVGFDWSADANYQAEARLHRGDLKEAVNSYYALYREGIDSSLMLAALDERVREHRELHKDFNAVLQVFKTKAKGDPNSS